MQIMERWFITIDEYFVELTKAAWQFEYLFECSVRIYWFVLMGFRYFLDTCLIASLDNGLLDNVIYNLLP